MSNKKKKKKKRNGVYEESTSFKAPVIRRRFFLDSHCHMALALSSPFSSTSICFPFSSSKIRQLVLVLVSSRLVQDYCRYSTFAFQFNTFSESEELFGNISRESSYASLIDHSTRETQLNQIYARLLVIGLQFSGFLIGKIVNRVANLGEIRYARRVFDEFPQPNVFLWNAIIRCYSRHGLYTAALQLYARMQGLRVNSDAFTFPLVLKACSALQAFEMGRRVHGQVFRLGFGSDVVVQNSLVAFYSKCGRLVQANLVFDRLDNRTIVSWTSIISGYAQNGKPLEALTIFCQMRKMSMKPDWIALVSVLRAYTDIQDLKHAKSVHGCVIKMGLEREPDLLVSLTAMYAKCGQVMIAKWFFNQTEVPDLILWNTMISGYSKNGYAEEAIELFRQMLSRKIRPDTITLTSSISACGQVGSVELARWMDDYVNNSELRNEVYVNTALIDMFAKCGRVDLARLVFERTLDKDVVLWTAMIVGYGLHGQGQESIKLFHAMRQAGVCANDVTFIGLLTACNHSGLVEEGWDLFNCMRDFGIEPQQQHYASVVDLLGRAGQLDRAYNFIREMPIEPGVSVWGALLSACKIHRRVSLGEYSAEKLFSLDPYNIGHYVQLSNLYASARMWDHVANLRELMKEKGLSKDLSYSSIEIDGKLQAFRVGDKSHPRYKEIFEEVENLERRLKEAGFIPDKDSILHDLIDEETEEMLCNHSERLAIAYGIINTPPGTTLRIAKNLRACINCHEATKFISKLVNREIVVRDKNRFHHFKDGVCSCGDFW